jgi:hypothetical protein
MGGQPDAEEREALQLSKGLKNRFACDFYRICSDRLGEAVSRVALARAVDIEQAAIRVIVGNVEIPAIGSDVAGVRPVERFLLVDNKYQQVVTAAYLRCAVWP